MSTVAASPLSSRSRAAVPGAFATGLVPVLLLLLVALAGRALYLGLPAALADAQTLRVRADVARWRSGTAEIPSGITWNHAREDITNAMARAPGNPQFYDERGFLHAYRGVTLPATADFAELRRSMFDAAADDYAQAARLRPMFPYDRAHQALALHHALALEPQDSARRAAVETALWANYDKAFDFGRNEPGVQRILAGIGFARWSELSPERAAALQKLVSDAPPPLQAPLRDIAARHAVRLDAGVRK